MTDWRLPGFTELHELGRGAQGRVVLARDEGTGELVAIKYLAPERLTDERALERFRGEARALAQAADPHVARLHGLRETAEGAAIVMEAVNGVSLRHLLDRYEPMSPESALVVLKGSLLGLAAAHAVGVVHRDYKPANVVVQADGLSKLVDFGVAGLAGSVSGGGTPVYMAPEQWEGRPAAPAADVYAATCVFFECVTGRRPYAAGDLAALRRQHLDAPVPVDAVPEPVRELVARGMAKDPAERPPGAAAFVTELEAVAGRAYGPDWEARGWGALGVATAAVAALFPLALAGMGAAGGGAAAGMAASAGAGAAQASGQAAGTGLLATTGAKVAVAVAATTAVATAGTGAYVVATEEDGPEVIERVSVTTPALTQTFPLEGQQPLQVDAARYVTVGGLADGDRQARINRALRAPLDKELAVFRAELDRRGPARRLEGDPGPARDIFQSEVTVGMRGPRLVSARYRMAAVHTGDVEGGRDVLIPVTVDLGTGRTLTLPGMLRPSALNVTGLRTLVQRAAFPPPRFGGGIPGCRVRPAEVERADFEPDRDGRVKFGLMFTPRHLEVSVSHVTYHCDDQIARVPYERVRDLLRPELMTALTAPVPERS